MNAKNKIIPNALLSGTVLALAGCAATQTAIEHGSLQVSTKQSETVFLEPVSNAEKTVYVSVKNTSDESVDITPQLKTALVSHGYKVMNNPEAAHYLLQANVLKVGKMSIAASQSALGGGYGSAIAGAAVGTAAGSFTNSSNGMIAGGLAGGVIGLAADALVKDVNYTMITDVLISEHAGRGVKVKEQFRANIGNGSSSGSSQSYSNTSAFKKYRVRIVSNADKVNLKFADARPALEQGLVKVISGIF
ncbi:Lipoprotein YlpA precursor [Legionella birminghamensis]|uniref:Lipoprotein YlpA n=1 Tax=Legionella birminghamensis TaxID=28083 RepID=A0A378JSI8_9GAMM|nr:complement resistance protein TraT [Legionella birminghamensis]KTC69811.1 Lipoprotein YlpA precursor [Legionella birminghamensis]STX60917.1 TraT complement resistance protein [Legionella birminghamensis]